MWTLISGITDWASSVPRWRDHPEAHESFNLHIASIAAAKETLYIEN